MLKAGQERSVAQARRAGVGRGSGAVKATARVDAPFSPRQREVLEVALRLLVEGGDKALTTSALASAANCSKESLYKWFGDRDELLAAVVTHQASKVRFIDEQAPPATADDFVIALRGFAEDLLSVLFSDTSLALNRLATGSVTGEAQGLGAVLLERGKQRIEGRAKRLLDAGRALGAISFDDADAAYGDLYGLILGDAHMRALLGDVPPRRRTDISRRAKGAIDRFLNLYAGHERAASKRT